MSQIYLFANWKMYLNYAESKALAQQVREHSAQFPPPVAMTVFPSALAISAVVSELQGTGVQSGTQNFYWVEKGGATGEISAEMCREAGCTYAIIGHSERRHLFNESNHEVRQKLEAALRAGLTPVLCVGETSAERADGQTAEVLESQLRAAYMDLAWPAGQAALIAYEPVWAVGTGEACRPAEAEKMSALIDAFVRGLLAVEPIILYGGSVRGANAVAYLALPHVSGVLVGGASTRWDSWAEIIAAAGTFVIPTDRASRRGSGVIP